MEKSPCQHDIKSKPSLSGLKCFNEPGAQCIIRGFFPQENSLHIIYDKGIQGQKSFCVRAKCEAMLS